MSAGKGFIALAALIFGRWHPVNATLACFLFGATEALQLRIQAFNRLLAEVGNRELLNGEQ